ncbi:hypothetical protein AB3N60_07600 [Leptospira sp. WS39.C2]
MSITFFALSLLINCSQISEYSESDCIHEFKQTEKRSSDLLVTTYFGSKDQNIIDIAFLEFFIAKQKRADCAKGRI